MSNRHKDFNEYLAEEFTDLEFAQCYISSLITDEGMTLEEALRESIKAMSLKAFSEKAGISIQVVSDFVNRRRNFKTSTMEKYIRDVFHLKLKYSLEKIT